MKPQETALGAVLAGLAVTLGRSPGLRGWLMQSVFRTGSSAVSAASEKLHDLRFPTKNLGETDKEWIDRILVTPTRTSAGSSAGQGREHRKVPTGSSQTRFLLTFSQPSGKQPISVDNEIKAIDRECEGNFETRIVPAVDARTLVERVRDGRPNLIHFAGHGTSDGPQGENAQGESSPLTQEFLVALMNEVAKPELQCVVINCCLSRATVEALSPHVPVVVGTSGVVSDDVAIAFSESFYGALAKGLTVGESFASAVLVSRNINPSHADRYILLGQKTIRFQS
jgi:CHAT domain